MSDQPLLLQRLLVAIVGPTGVGKTGFSVELAERLDGEIISADSRTFYRGMDLGTAKPSIEQRRRVPHHLIDIADPDQVLSLVEFQQLAGLAIAGVQHRQRLPILVGGTGQYVRALTEGWQAPPVPPDSALRAAIFGWGQQIGAQELHTRLAKLDPVAAGAIDPRNVRRTVRALEVILSSGMRFSEQRRQGTPRYRILMIGLNRPRGELYARVDQRIDDMLRAGLVAEARSLLERYPRTLPVFSAIGYREAMAHLAGELTLDEVRLLMMRQTRVFIRRQANWFKPDNPGIHWIDMQGGESAAAVTLVLRRLAGE
jgi:tRNA dimethylallyltransferase